MSSRKGAGAVTPSFGNKGIRTSRSHMATARAARMTVDTLERRLAMDTSFATVVAGVLTVTGTDEADTISLELANDHIVATMNGQTASIPLKTFARTQVNANGGDDTVSLGSSLFNLAYTQALTVDGGEGNDTLTYNGTDGDDSFAIQNNSVFGKSGQSSGYVLNLQANEALIVNGLGGDDAFIVKQIFRAQVSVFGGSGNDQFAARYMSNDTIDGGDGYDSAVVDPGDVVTNCEDASELGTYLSPVEGVPAATESGVAASFAITIRNSNDPTYLKLDWGDGTIVKYSDTDLMSGIYPGPTVSHVYADSGTYSFTATAA